MKATEVLSEPESSGKMNATKEMALSTATGTTIFKISVRGRLRNNRRNVRYSCVSSIVGGPDKISRNIDFIFQICEK